MDPVGLQVQHSTIHYVHPVQSCAALFYKSFNQKSRYISNLSQHYVELWPWPFTQPVTNDSMQTSKPYSDILNLCCQVFWITSQLSNDSPELSTRIKQVQLIKCDQLVRLSRRAETTQNILFTMWYFKNKSYFIFNSVHMEQFYCQFNFSCSYKQCNFYFNLTSVQK